MRKSRTWLVVVFWIVCAVSRAQTPATASDVSAMEAVLSEAYPPAEPGAAVIVTKDGKTIVRKGCGMASLELSVPIRPDMVFRIGSLTKQFTAATILLLAERGKLAIEDDVTKFLPDYPTHGGKITIEHLLTHTSGIKSYTELNSFLPRMREDLSLDALIGLFKDEPPVFAPGTRWAYCNSGYVLLGAIVEKASGVPYGEFLQTNVFDSLGMKRSTLGDDRRVIPDRVCGYEKEAGRYVNSAYMSMTQPYAAGAILSTVDDLTLWDAALASEKFLKKASLDRAFTPAKLVSGESTKYGFGWGISDYEGHRVVSHSGGINGFLSHDLRMPEDHVFVAVLSNNMGAKRSPEWIAKRLAAIAIGKPMKGPVTVAVDSKILDTYVGRYELAPGFVIEITRDGNALFAQATGQGKAELFAQSESEFSVEVVEARFTFTKDAIGKVTGLTLIQGGQSHPGKRLE